MVRLAGCGWITTIHHPHNMRRRKNLPSILVTERHVLAVIAGAVVVLY